MSAQSVTNDLQRHSVSRTATATLLLFFVGCAPLATVSHVRPRPAVLHEAATELVKAQRYLADGQSLAHREPLRSLGNYLAAAKIASQRFEQQPNDSAAFELYNFAVARSVEIVDSTPLDVWDRALTVPGPDQNYHLRASFQPRRDYQLVSYRFTPSDSLRVGGAFFHQRTLSEGVGAPLVMIGGQEQEAAQRSFAPQRVYGTATATIQFNGNGTTLDIVDALAVDRVRVRRRDLPLAADFTTPLGFAMAAEHPEKLGFARLMAPDEYSDTAQLLRLQPYESTRTPVIFVHGLQDTPASWAPMIEGLVADPEIRRRYQFWVFSYPSGYPYPYSAMLLRHELDGIARAFPDHKPVVLVGHSMGGMVCRLMVTDSGDRIWRDLFGTAPANTHLEATTRALLEDALIFHHRNDVKRVVFISTPHRGSEIASSWVGRLASGIIRRAPIANSIWAATRQIQIADPAAAPLKRAPNSIDTLEPNDRFVRAVNRLPLSRAIPYHSIIGDRGRGDTPNSSDGVVPYWSSHLEEAQSELVVPSGHAAERDPAAIAEVRRILAK